MSKKSKTFVDIDGRKVILDEEYEIGDQMGFNDIYNNLKNQYIESSFNKSIINYLKKLSNSSKFIDNIFKYIGNENDISLYFIFFLFTVILSILLTFLINYLLQTNEITTKSTNITEEEIKKPLRDFTYEQLLEFNGAKDANDEFKPIFIALRNEVYDVSNAREMYGPEGGYHCFAGKDASRAMAKLSFDDSELNNHNLDDLSPFEVDILNDWIMKYKYYKSYPIVGKVSKPIDIRNFTVEELTQYKGDGDIPENRVDAPIYLGINGKVIDVSYGGKEMYGKDGAYHIFAGIDASRALAKMSFSPEDINSRDLNDLTGDQRKTLLEWEKKFIEIRKYPLVGYLQ